MTEYFARLIQQTGITVETGFQPQYNLAVPLPDLSAPVDAAPDMAEFLAMEDIQVITPLSEALPVIDAASSPSPTPKDGVSTEAVTLGPLTNRDMPHPVEVTVGRENSPHLSHPTEQRIERIEPSSSTVQPRLSEFAVQPVSASAAQNNPAKPHPKQVLPKADPSRPMVYSNDASQEPARSIPTDVSEELSRPLPSHQVSWQMLQDWVSGTSPIAEEVGEGEVSQVSDLPSPHAMGMFNVSQSEGNVRQGRALAESGVTSVANELPWTGFAPGPVETFATPRLETQELVLSIGSIHVTVEQPPTAVRHPPTLAAQPRSTPQPDHEPSRLRRHYLRLR